MLSSARARLLLQACRRSGVSMRRSSALSAHDKAGTKEVPNVSKTNELATETSHRDQPLQESAEHAEELRVAQAPNMQHVWSRSQNPRAKAMSGPRFEQTIMEYQPAPQAAIDLIHKQPVRWTHDRYVACDGGGGPLGHPRVFINVDKPQICMCEYCGLPYANEHHRKHLESQAETSYPLVAEGHAAEVSEPQRVTDEALSHR